MKPNEITPSKSAAAFSFTFFYHGSSGSTSPPLIFPLTKDTIEYLREMRAPGNGIKVIFPPPPTVRKASIQFAQHVWEQMEIEFMVARDRGEKIDLSPNLQITQNLFGCKIIIRGV